MINNAILNKKIHFPHFIVKKVQFIAFYIEKKVLFFLYITKFIKIKPYKLTTDLIVMCAYFIKIYLFNLSK